eukprot:gene4748-biopygen22054
MFRNTFPNLLNGKRDSIHPVVVPGGEQRGRRESLHGRCDRVARLARCIRTGCLGRALTQTVVRRRTVDCGGEVSVEIPAGVHAQREMVQG